MSGRGSYSIDYAAERRREEQRRRGIAQELRQMRQQARQACAQASGAWAALRRVTGEFEAYLNKMESRLSNLAAIDIVNAEVRPEIERRLAEVREAVETERKALLSECEEARQTAGATGGGSIVLREAAQRVETLCVKLTAAANTSRANELNDRARRELRERLDTLLTQKRAEDDARAGRKEAQQRRAQDEAVRRHAEEAAQLSAEVGALKGQINAARDLLGRWSIDALVEMEHRVADLEQRARDEGVRAEAFPGLRQNLREQEDLLRNLIEAAEAKNARIAERETLMREVAQALGELGLKTTSIGILGEGDGETLVLDVTDPTTGLWMRWEFPAEEAKAKYYASHSSTEACTSDFEVIRKAFERRGLLLSYERLGPLPGGDALALPVEHLRRLETER